MLSSVLLSLLCCSSKGVAGDKIVRIKNAKEFKTFVNNVNGGNKYSRTTVYLESDLSLSEVTEPIGINSTYSFRGVFDGQGYAISDLKVNSSSKYAGLFGYSGGLTIRNVVLDSSCYISSSFNGSYFYMGGVIGYCSEQCNIENSVNMANVTFSGGIGGTRHHLYFGGIAGYLLSYSSYSAYVKNCANYGSVTVSETVCNYVELGGIVGFSYGSSSKYIQNCLNNGTITHSGTSSNLNIGGIVGCGNCTYIENCVSAGKITMLTTASTNNNIGSIVGEANTNTHINYCYYTSDVGISSINGAGAPILTGTSDSSIIMDSSFVSKLNSNATSCNWSKWLLNTNNAIVTFKMDDDKNISFSSQVILIPNPVKEGNSFLFWCEDAGCNDVLSPEIKQINKNITLYAAWIPNNYTVTFDFNNGTTVNVTFTYNESIIYPEDKKEGYTLSWDNYHEHMPAKDITVTARWIPNNYTVTFDANGGNVSETSKIVTFNEEYDKLPEATKHGYMFFGWLFTNETNGTEATNETIVTTPYNHTLYAHWEEVTTQVEIVFSTKDLTKEEVIKLIEKYAKTNFEIAHFEIGSGEIRVIIGFTNKKEAEDFVRKIKESDRTTRMFKTIRFVSNDVDSFSITTYPPSFFSFLFFMVNY